VTRDYTRITTGFRGARNNHRVPGVPSTRKVQTHLTPDEYNALRELADSRDVTVSDLVRDAVLAELPVTS
jgi:hypothetical protein